MLDQKVVEALILGSLGREIAAFSLVEEEENRRLEACNCGRKES